MALTAPLLKSNYELYTTRRRPSGGNIKVSRGGGGNGKLSNSKRHYSLPAIAAASKQGRDTRGHRSSTGRGGTTSIQGGSMIHLASGAAPMAHGSPPRNIVQAQRYGSSPPARAAHIEPQQHTIPSPPHQHNDAPLSHSPPLLTSQRRHAGALPRQQSSIRSSNLSEATIEEEEEPAESSNQSLDAACRKLSQALHQRAAPTPAPVLVVPTITVQHYCDAPTAVAPAAVPAAAPSETAAAESVEADDPPLGERAPAGADHPQQADSAAQRTQQHGEDARRQASVDSGTGSGRRVRFGTIEQCDYDAAHPSGSVADNEHRQIAFKKDSYERSAQNSFNEETVSDKDPSATIEAQGAEPEETEQAVEPTTDAPSTKCQDVCTPHGEENATSAAVRRRPAYRRLLAAAVRPCIGKAGGEP